MQNKLSGYGPSLIVLATAMLVLFAGPSAVRKLTYERTQAQITQASLRLNDGNILEQINQAYRDIAMRVEPSVVHISVLHLIPVRGGARQAISSGSGWVYDTKGNIVTNYHVVRDAERVEVQLDSGELREAEIVGFDDTTDIAVLNIQEGRLHPAPIADPTDTVKQGDMVFAFGSPFDFRFSMSSGVISGKGRSVGVIRDEQGQRFGYENFIQVDAAINPGNSGGPLTNFRGEVIGMNTAIATGRQTQNPLEEGQFAGIGLAIPLEMIIPVVEQLIENGYVTKGFLGVEILNLDQVLPHVHPDVTRVFREWGFVGQGVVLTRVFEDGPAGQAGLMVNDIIINVNGRATRTMTQLQSIVSSIRPGETVELEVWRYDELAQRSRTSTFSIRLDRLNTIMTTGQIPPDHPRDSLRELGIASMESNTPALANRYDMPFHNGVMLNELVPGSRLGQFAEAGWVIVGVSDFTVRDVDEFFSTLEKFDLTVPLTLDLIDTEGALHQIQVRAER